MGMRGQGAHPGPRVPQLTWSPCSNWPGMQQEAKPGDGSSLRLRAGENQQGLQELTVATQQPPRTLGQRPTATVSSEPKPSSPRFCRGPRGPPWLAHWTPGPQSRDRPASRVSPRQVPTIDSPPWGGRGCTGGEGRAPSSGAQGPGARTNACSAGPHLGVQSPWPALGALQDPLPSCPQGPALALWHLASFPRVLPRWP